MQVLHLQDSGYTNVRPRASRLSEQWQEVRAYDLLGAANGDRTVPKNASLPFPTMLPCLLPLPCTLLP